MKRESIYLQDKTFERSVYVFRIWVLYFVCLTQTMLVRDLWACGTSRSSLGDGLSHGLRGCDDEVVPAWCETARPSRRGPFSRRHV